MGFSLGNFKLTFHQITLETSKEESGVIAAVIIIVLIIITIIVIIIKLVAMPPIRIALEGREERIDLRAEVACREVVRKTHFLLSQEQGKPWRLCQNVEASFGIANLATISSPG